MAVILYNFHETILVSFGGVPLRLSDRNSGLIGLHLLSKNK